jgi:hypothetical protein
MSNYEQFTNTLYHEFGEGKNTWHKSEIVAISKILWVWEMAWRIIRGNYLLLTLTNSIIH